jgi:hypothetical protein
MSSTGQVKYRDLSGVVTHIPVTADLDVQGTKTQGFYSGAGKYDKATKTYSFNEDACKNLAVQNAIERAGADILIEPMFAIETVGGTITVKVTGYPATYKNFRSATLKDKELLETHPTESHAVKSEAAVISK